MGKILKTIASFIKARKAKKIPRAGLYLRGDDLVWIQKAKAYRRILTETHPGVYVTSEESYQDIREERIPRRRISCVEELIYAGGQFCFKIYNEYGELWASIFFPGPGKWDYFRYSALLENALGPKTEPLRIQEEEYKGAPYLTRKLLYSFGPDRSYPRLRLLQDWNGAMAERLMEGFEVWPGGHLEKCPVEKSLLLPWATPMADLIKRQIVRRNEDGKLSSTCPIRVAGLLMEAGVFFNLYYSTDAVHIGTLSVHNKNIQDMAGFCRQAAPGFEDVSGESHQSAALFRLRKAGRAALDIQGDLSPSWHFTGIWKLSIHNWEAGDEEPRDTEDEMPERKGPQLEAGSAGRGFSVQHLNLETGFKPFAYSADEELRRFLKKSGRGFMWRNPERGELGLAMPGVQAGLSPNALIIPLAMVKEFTIERVEPAKGSGCSSLFVVLPNSGKIRVLHGENTHDLDFMANDLADVSRKRVIFQPYSSDV